MSMTRRALLGAALGLAVVLAGTVVARVVADRRPALPVYWAAPSFELVDQAGDTVRTADLRGSAWLASFVFTNCLDVCPAISAQMARAATRLRSDGLLGTRARLVSFTVDPERDTPDVLRDYAARFGARPPAEWAFLTGIPGDSMRAMIQQGFRLSAMMPDAPDPMYQVMHSPRVLLVDPAGDVRGVYDATDPAAVDSALTDLRGLVED